MRPSRTILIAIIFIFPFAFVDSCTKICLALQTRYAGRHLSILVALIIASERSE